jgi:hypothetical protein
MTTSKTSGAVGQLYAHGGDTDSSGSTIGGAASRRNPRGGSIPSGATSEELLGVGTFKEAMVTVLQFL